MAEYRCVGPAMAADWEAEQVCVTRPLVLRSFSYFLPYWQRDCWRVGLYRRVRADGFGEAGLSRLPSGQVCRLGGDFSFS